MSYRLTEDAGVIRRIADGACIPVAPGNVDYVEYQAWRAAGNTPEPYAPPPAPVPARITRRQCAKQMKVMGLITGAEAVAMTMTGTPPAMVAQMIQTLPADDRDDASIDFAADTYERGNPLLVALMTAVPGTTTEDIDDFFRAAAAL